MILILIVILTVIDTTVLESIATSSVNPRRPVFHDSINNAMNKT